DSLWPCLSKHIVKKQAAPSGTSVLVKQNVSSPIIKAASQEYPWASKMKSVCNLNRVTVPVYLEDGTSKFVLQRGFWHVDDCLMFVSSWTPTKTIFLPEISTIPIWLTLKNIPNQLYSLEGIKWIASGIGEPMLTFKPWPDPTLMGEAKILVEIKLDIPFAQRVAIEDENGPASLVDVLYSWLPSKCARCGHLGHKASRCLGQPLEPARSTKTSCPISGNVVTSIISAVETDSMLVDTEERDTTIIHSVLNVTVPHTPTLIVDVTSASAITLEDATIKPKDHITITEEKKSSSKKDTSFSLKGNVGRGSPKTISEHLSTPAVACNTPSNSHTFLVSSKETPSSSSNLVSANSVPTSCRIRKSLSSSNLLTYRFSSLESSDDEDESLSDEELDPKENLSSLGKFFLRDRPVKPSTKVKEMQSHPVARGRGNHGRGKRGGRG
ncbi:unnamed protein product, partial [Brassica oleracea]